MNDPLLGTRKLESLLAAAAAAKTEADRAAIYAAARWITADLDAVAAERDPSLSENIERARWSIGAMLGYDITNGHSADMHHSWAMAAITRIREVLSE